MKVPLPGAARNSERQVTISSASKEIAYKYGEGAVTQVEYAKIGYTFVFVRYDVKNIGPDTITVSGGDFSIRNPEGTRYDPITTKGTGSTNRSFLTDLGTNQSISNDIIFEVPLTAKNLALYYDFGNVSPGIRLAYWNID